MSMPNHLPLEKRRRIFHLLCEGNGIRSITRLVKCSTNTVSELQKKYCSIVEFINKTHFKGLQFDEIEADEIRTFVYKKDNIRWIFIAMERNSRCVLHFHIGNRDTASAREFLVGLSHKLDSNYNVSTDNLLSYISAVEKNPYGRIDAEVSKINMIRGENPGKVLGRGITNRVERGNGTVRQHVSRLIRKTKCFSKKEEGLRQHLTLFFFYYNFIKINKAHKATPVLVAGISDEAYWEDKIIEYDMLFSENMANKSSKRSYGVLDPGSKKVLSISEGEKGAFMDELAAISGFQKTDRKRGTYNKAGKVIKMIS